jgi:hypothetical protein
MIVIPGGAVVNEGPAFKLLAWLDCRAIPTLAECAGFVDLRSVAAAAVPAIGMITASKDQRLFASAFISLSFGSALDAEVFRGALAALGFWRWFNRPVPRLRSGAGQ